MPRHHRLRAPIRRAYLLAVLSTAGPRAVSLILARRHVLPKLWRALQQTAGWNRFPAACALLVGGALHFQLPIRILCNTVADGLGRRRFAVSSATVELLTEFLAAFLAAGFSFALLNSRPSRPLDYHAKRGGNASSDDEQDELTRDVAPTLSGPIPRLPPSPPSSASTHPLAGKTIDLTLFAVIRALDILVTPALASRPERFSRLVGKASTPFLFALSSAMIMHAWVYTPHRLPPSYNAWISSAAQLDPRLLLVLRHARYGHFIYGRETGMAPVLGSMCRDYGWPEEWGDPAKTIPVPCEMVHHGCGPSCEKHAIWRFARSWAFAAKMYVPLQLLVFLKRLHGSDAAVKSRADLLLRALLDASRNSAFLGAFVALFYYGVCLSRTRLGPRLFSRETVSPQMMDGGLCIAGGCALCGWSVLLEKASRRTEILFFVLPRAAAVVFPRRYLREHMWREHLAFATSAAVIITAAQERPERVRGVLGKVIGNVLKSGGT